MDQNAMAQVQSALDYVNKDLDRVQTSLSNYETMMVKGERVSPQLRELVVYYRDQTTALRKEMLSLCELMTAYYRQQLVKKAREDLTEQQIPPSPPKQEVLPPLLAELLHVEEQPQAQEPAEEYAPEAITDEVLL